MSTARKWRASQKKKPWLRGQMEGAPREVYDGFTVINNTPNVICRGTDTLTNLQTYKLTNLHTNI